MAFNSPFDTPRANYLLESIPAGWWRVACVRCKCVAFSSSNDPTSSPSRSNSTQSSIETASLPYKQRLMAADHGAHSLHLAESSNHWVISSRCASSCSAINEGMSHRATGPTPCWVPRRNHCSLLRPRNHSRLASRVSRNAVIPCFQDRFLY